MASASFPFCSSNNPQPFKLLDLPPSLLSLLEDSGSRPSTLQLATSSTSSQALLKTPTATYELRQKNTSNPLMVLAPSNTGDGDAVENVAGVSIIGKCEDTIELIEAKEGEKAEVVTEGKKKGKWHEKFARK